MKIKSQSEKLGELHETIISIIHVKLASDLSEANRTELEQLLPQVQSRKNGFIEREQKA